MRAIIEKLMAAFGWQRVKPQPTLAEAAHHFGMREAAIRNEARAAQFEAYHTGIAQGELYGRNALAAELMDKPPGVDEVAAAQMRVLH